MGGDKQISTHFVTDGSFNPRPHMGGDRFWGFTLMQFYRFNPRPHMGGDLADAFIKSIL